MPRSAIFEICGRSLTVDDEDVALTRKLDVVEEAGLVERTNRLFGAVGRELIALFDRQIREHRARCDARQSVDADVGDREAVERDCVPGRQTSKQQ